MKAAGRERERPFVALVLQQQTSVAAPTETDLARVERLVRWWKMKTKENRDIDGDSAKALRMIVRAFDAGEDYDNDPERLLFGARDEQVEK